MSVKTLRFGPLPSKLDEKGTTGDPATWDKFIDIPPDTRVRVIALPAGQEVIDTLATRSHSWDYDPGKYRYCMQKTISGPGNGTPGRVMRAEGEFLIDLTEPQWFKLCNSTPKAASPAQTTEGVVWSCKMPGCQMKTKTQVAAFLHESKDHYGIDLLKHPEKLIDAEVKALSVGEELKRAARTEGKKSPGDILAELASD